MKKVILLLSLFLLSTALAQTNQVFYSGKGWPDGMWTWPGGFSEDPKQIDGKGFTPGTHVFEWGAPQVGSSEQYFFFGFDSGWDLSSSWDTDTVYFKLKAPNGVTAGDTMSVWIYSPTNWDDWDNAIYYNIPNYQDLDDTEWHQFAVPLSEFVVNVNDIDKTNIAAVSFEAHGNLISEIIYFDDVFLNKPDVNMTQVVFNGKTVVDGYEVSLAGFENNNLIISEGEGFEEGTNAIVWENNNATGFWDAYMGFGFAPQDYSYAMGVDTFQIKIKAPAGINDLAFVFWDQNWNAATKVLDGVTWDGNWQEFKIALADFTQDGGLNLEDIFYFQISPNGDAIPERLLFDDIWVGNPTIDFLPPPTPDGLLVSADESFPYTNFIYWNNTSTESGEVYNVYSSRNPITDLDGEGVFAIALGVNESEDATNVITHGIYYPLEENNVSYYYAVNCVDANGNESESFATIAEPFSNVGEKRAIVSLDAINFTADGDLSEWANIMPFRMMPDPGHVSGIVDDSLDFSAYVYVAMDSENLYVAIDVIDDVFSYRAENTQDWWEDEAIEFFFGLYDIKKVHSYWERGEEPDYRVVFKPYELELLSQDVLASGTEYYYFEDLGESDYVLEAKIPFSMIKYEEDALFTPENGMTIPFEVFATDADVVDGGSEGRVQLGDNPALNPWGDGPKAWTFAWVGMPVFTDVNETNLSELTYSLENNYPNPFNPSTKIDFSIANAGHVKLIVYNTLGQEIATIVNNELPAGVHSAMWNGSNKLGKKVSSGIYFYRIKSGEFISTKKMMLLK